VACGSESRRAKVAAVRPVAERVVAADIVSNLEPLEADDHTQAMRAAARRGPGDGDLADGRACDPAPISAAGCVAKWR
jgi:hypothetical protein